MAVNTADALVTTDVVFDAFLSCLAPFDARRWTELAPQKEGFVLAHLGARARAQGCGQKDHTPRQNADALEAYHKCAYCGRFDEKFGKKADDVTAGSLVKYVHFAENDATGHHYYTGKHERRCVSCLFREERVPFEPEPEDMSFAARRAHQKKNDDGFTEMCVMQENRRRGTRHARECDRCRMKVVHNLDEVLLDVVQQYTTAKGCETLCLPCASADATAQLKCHYCRRARPLGSLAFRQDEEDAASASGLCCIGGCEHTCSTCGVAEGFHRTVGADYCAKCVPAALAAACTLVYTPCMDECLGLDSSAESGCGRRGLEGYESPTESMCMSCCRKTTRFIPRAFVLVGDFYVFLGGKVTSAMLMIDDTVAQKCPEADSAPLFYNSQLYAEALKLEFTNHIREVYCGFVAFGANVGVFDHVAAFAKQAARAYAATKDDVRALKDKYGKNLFVSSGKERLQAYTLIVAAPRPGRHHGPRSSRVQRLADRAVQEYALLLRTRAEPV